MKQAKQRTFEPRRGEFRANDGDEEADTPVVEINFAGLPGADGAGAFFGEALATVCDGEEVILSVTLLFIGDMFSQVSVLLDVACHFGLFSSSFLQKQNH